MYVNKKIVFIGLVLICALVMGNIWIALAGSLSSTATPGSTSYFTLEQVYNAVASDSGDNVARIPSFAEPVSGPGSTMHSVDEIMAELIGQVPKTGQTKCYNDAGTVVSCDGTGQDGEHRMGALPVLAPTSGVTGAYTIADWDGQRFTDNGNGTVTDNVTGLIWLKNAACFGFRNWSTALANANGLANGACGLSDGSSVGDWRLPNTNELHSLIDLTQSNPALPAGHSFSAVQSNFYWSSTSSETYPDSALGVNLSNGGVFSTNRSNNIYVWPVRGGQ